MKCYNFFPHCFTNFDLTCAYGMEPDSNQQSNTSGIRFKGGWPGLAEGMVMWSMLSR